MGILIVLLYSIAYLQYKNLHYYLIHHNLVFFVVLFQGERKHQLEEETLMISVLSLAICTSSFSADDPLK